MILQLAGWKHQPDRQVLCRHLVWLGTALQGAAHSDVCGLLLPKSERCQHGYTAGATASRNWVVTKLFERLKPQPDYVTPIASLALIYPSQSL